MEAFYINNNNNTEMLKVQPKGSSKKFKRSKNENTKLCDRISQQKCLSYPILASFIKNY